MFQLKSIVNDIHFSFFIRAFTKIATGPLQSGGGGQNTYR